MMHLQHEGEKLDVNFSPLSTLCLMVTIKPSYVGKTHIYNATPSVNIQSASWFLDTKSTELHF